MIVPQSTLKKLWDAFIGISTLACTIIIPFNIAFHLNEHPEFEKFLWNFDLVVTCLFFLDIVISFRTARIHELDQSVLREPKAIAMSYMFSGEFAVDVISVFPFFLFDSSTINFVIKLFVFSRFLRIFKLFKQWNRISWFISHVLGSNYSQVLSIMFWLPIILHVLSCGWLRVNNTTYDDQILLHYVQAVYWCTTTITTIGYGDITPDRTNIMALTYTMVVQIIGAALYGFSIGNIANLLAKRDALKTHHLEKMDRINAFFRYRKIPQNLQTQAHNYFNYIWLTQRGYDENSVLNELPTNIKTEVALYLKRELLDKVEMFHNSSDSLKREMALNMQSAIYLPNEMIINYGDIGEEMYFISKGKVSVISADMKTTYATLYEGSFFGEIALLKETVRTANVQAVEHCDLYILNKQTFDRVISRYPDFADTIKNMASQRQN